MSAQVHELEPTFADIPADVTDRTLEAVVFDWDGTAVPDRRADASQVRAGIEALCAAGVHVFVVSGTHVGNVDGQLAARPAGPGQLHLCLNRGSEVFSVHADGPSLIWRRTATTGEEAALDRAARLTVEQLRVRGIEAEVVSQRLNRRKIDLIPEPAWADPPKARIGELLAAVLDRLQGAGLADLAEVVALAAHAAQAAGLTNPRITSDAKHVEIGLTDKSDSARWAAAWLRERGISGGLVLLGGDEFGTIGGVPGSDSHLLVAELARAAVVSVGVEPAGCPSRVTHVGGGPERFLEILDTQLARRQDRRVPSLDRDPAWILPLPEDPTAQRAAESLATLSNGWAGSRGALEEGGSVTALFTVNGMYTSDSTPELLAGPCWDQLRIEPTDTPSHRLLDLRTGVLAREDPSGLRSLRFISASRPAALALRAEGPPGQLHGGATLAAPVDGGAFEGRRRDGAHLARVRSTPGAGAIAMAARHRNRVVGHLRTLERLAAWVADASRVPGWEEALEQLGQCQDLGFDGLLAEHRQAWAQRWADAEVRIEGNPDDELAARFAVFHLLAAAPDHGEAAVGARGLSGRAYGGHVFWDSDVFVLPALAAIRPAAARAMLEYRIRRLGAARDAAAARGLSGARFPWESAGDGTDVTPRQVPGRRGELVPVHTGERQDHIVADIAWAASRYAEWTGDTAFLPGAGRGLLVETARYWASRIHRDADGRAHIDGVMGPDEYHPEVDDNAYTNVMARWNLRRAADLVERASGKSPETTGWWALADALVDGYDPSSGLYEQFAGYWQHETLLVADVAAPPVAADVLLGPERVAGSQLIKQADVVMLHHLVPGELVPGALTADLAYYEPRTAHGSSLSPAIYAAQLARAGKPDQALALFRLAARLDLDDITGTTSGGLHLAAMGGVWQALAYGFLGLRALGTTLGVDPCLPGAWDALAVRFRFRGQPLRVRADHDRVTISCAEPLDVRIASGPVQSCEPPGCTYSVERSRP